MEWRKLTKEDIDKVRNIDGFPIGADEDIIALSDPPYYTSCPNPFIEDFIRENGTPYDEATDDYHREPFSADVSEGKNDPIYTAHSYHTKVPYKAIMRYILHYTKPGDIVFDGFCGSGMTGVAAQMCGHPENEIKIKIEREMENVSWGTRSAILNDLSPAAQQITYGYNIQTDVIEFSKKANEVLTECEQECGWVYRTKHILNSEDFLPEAEYGRILYTVWSDVFVCPQCGNEFVFYDVAYDSTNNKIMNKFPCPQCSARLTKKDCERAKEYNYSSNHSGIHQSAKQVPVLIVYSFEGKKYTKVPDEFDLELIDKINHMTIPYWYPKDDLPNGNNTQQPKVSHGFYTVDNFYTKRNLYVLSCLNNKIENSRLRIAFQAINTTLSSKLVRYNMGNRGNGPLNGTLYVASLIAESNVLNAFRGKVDDFIKVYSLTSGFKNSICNTSSSSCLVNIPNNSIDYIFIDPPFGANLNYSELSFIWESWLKVRTNNLCEAIMNDVQGKGLPEYQQLMSQCFNEYYRILKPNRWMTVEFHNSKNSVWNAIQESLQYAGFIVADVRTLDKKQGSFKQVTTSSAVKQDLVISVYKPKESFQREFLAQAGGEESVWSFVRQHLENLPIVVRKNDHIELVSERQSYLLFDRMVAYHIMNGISVPMDATDFYRGLDERFLKRDNMYFLSDQVNEYDTARITAEVEDIQFDLFVTNEKSAIAWLYQQLGEDCGGSKTYAQLQPMFMQEVKTVDQFEDMPELMIMLEQNFLQDENGRWYIPDVKKEADVAKLREKNLWKEFQGYMNSRGKIKLFRSEAIRVGFAHLWREKDYQAIVDMAERLPEKIIQEDTNLLMYYDISLDRV